MDQSSNQPSQPSGTPPSQGQGQAVPQKSNRLVSAIIGIVVAVLAGAYVMMNKKQAVNTTENMSGEADALLEEEGETAEEEALEQEVGETEPVNTTPTQPEPVTNEPATTPVSALSHKDGTYTAVGNYLSPGGPEQVGVTLTLKDDVIVDSSFEIKAERPISKNMQTVFSENYKALVVGKDIDEVSLTKVSTSSLTPKGFNDALTKIGAGSKI